MISAFPFFTGLITATLLEKMQCMKEFVEDLYIKHKIESNLLKFHHT